jgi:hypothetical protein
MTTTGASETTATQATVPAVTETSSTITPTTTNSQPSSTTQPSPSGSTTPSTYFDEDEGLGDYLSRIVPLVTHHADAVAAKNAAQDELAAGIQGAGDAPSFEDIMAYHVQFHDLLLGVQEQIDTNLAETLAIDPPAKATGFHDTFTQTMEKEREAVAGFITYTNQMIADASHNEAVFTAAANAQDVAIQLWTSALSQLDKLTDG